MSPTNILTWSEVEDAAKNFFDEWIDYYEWWYCLIEEYKLQHIVEEIDLKNIQWRALEWIKNAWGIVQQAGLASYVSELEFCVVLVRFISLLDFYSQSCAFTLESEIEDYYLYLANSFEVNENDLMRLIYNVSFFDLPIKEINKRKIYFLIKDTRKEIINILVKQFKSKSNLAASIKNSIYPEIEDFLNRIKFNEDDEFERLKTEEIYENKFWEDLLEDLTEKWQEIVSAEKLANLFQGELIAIPEDLDYTAIPDYISIIYESKEQCYENAQTIPVPEDFPEEDFKPYFEPSWLTINDRLLSRKIHLSEQILRRYHLALKTKKFVILSGISGIGKTWLTQVYANAVGAIYLLVPVAPNWTTNEDLLGYFNPIDNKYHHTTFSRFLEKATEEYEKAQAYGCEPVPYHIVLDEMNLARVEYYFAKFLSAMEVRMRDGVAEIELAPHEVVLLPPNLYFIGTVNMDETTHGFADKVYDRAQLIELEVSHQDLYEYLGEVEYREILMQIWDKVHEVAPFAFRVLNDIKIYVREAAKLNMSWEEALDEQLLQKILPKLKGTDERLEQTLDDFIKIAEENNFPVSLEKAKKMLDKFINHGFTSYF